MTTKEMIDITTQFMDGTTTYGNVRADGNMGEIIKAFIISKSIEKIYYSFEPKIGQLSWAINNLAKSIEGSHVPETKNVKVSE